MGGARVVNAADDVMPWSDHLECVSCQLLAIMTAFYACIMAAFCSHAVLAKAAYSSQQEPFMSLLQESFNSRSQSLTPGHKSFAPMTDVKRAGAVTYPTEAGTSDHFIDLDMKRSPRGATSDMLSICTFCLNRPEICDPIQMCRYALRASYLMKRQRPDKRAMTPSDVTEDSVPMELLSLLLQHQQAR